MATTYEPIATTTLGSAASSITLSSIPATYTDLYLVLNIISSAANNDVRLQLNMDSGSNYNNAYMSASTTNRVGSAAVLNNSYILSYAATGTTTSNNLLTWHFLQYRNTSVQKVVLGRIASTLNEVGIIGANWNSTAAINSIYIYSAGNTAPQTFAAGSTATLYGILKA